MNLKKLIKLKSIDIASFNCPNNDVLDLRKVSLARFKNIFYADKSSDLVRNNCQDVDFAEAYRVPFVFSKEISEIFPYHIFRENGKFDAFSSYGVKVFDESLYVSCLKEACNSIEKDGFYLNEFHPIVKENLDFLKSVSGLDYVSFHMSGTEAVMHAIRLAKFNTGKKRIVKFKDAYHGWCLPDDVTEIIEPEDLHQFKDCAAVLVNPLSSLYKGIPKTDALLFGGSSSESYDKKYESDRLKTLRKICDIKGVALIMDEVFLGFRVAYGGCQEYFGVHADIVTYGKTIGGGFPIGVVCASSKFGKRYDSNHPAAFLGNKGTFSAHPMGMVAMNHFIKSISKSDYDGTDSIWNLRVEELNKETSLYGFEFKNLHSVIALKITPNASHNWILQFYLAKNGVKLGPYGSSRFIFKINLDETDWNIFKNKLILSLSEMKQDGWLDIKHKKKWKLYLEYIKRYLIK